MGLVTVAGGYEIYEQLLYDCEDGPEEADWEPFTVIGSIEHNGMRASQGGGYECRTAIYWRRKVKKGGNDEQPS